MLMYSEEIAFQSDIPSEQEFLLYQGLIFKELGISLPLQKRAMLGHRLSKRLRHLGLQSFADYFAYITSSKHLAEKQKALELITTNETFFFREGKHFDFLKERILPYHPVHKPFKVWSAACATGEEPYSIAMVLQDQCRSPWSVLASDVNQTVLSSAKKGIYLDARTSELPEHYRHRFCRKGQNEYEGQLRVVPKLRTKVSFQAINLLSSLDQLGQFELIFLRNVLIYFDSKLKQEIILKVMKHLNPGGYLFIGHSETCHGIHPRLRSVQPAIMQFDTDLSGDSRGSLR